MHQGQTIHRVVKLSGISITQLAKKIKKSRQSVYNIFDSPNVPNDLIIEIGKAIHYDFSRDFKQLRNYSTDSDVSVAEEKKAEYWKQKYISLLEEYNQLLKNKKK